MSATQCDEIIGAEGSNNTDSQIRKIGYLRRLKALLSDVGASRAWNLKNFIVDRLRCEPHECRCKQRRFILRFLCPLESEQTMKKKFFVLRAETATHPACLEYYENEKKWKSGGQPKRSIVLKSCFNINRKLDVKQKHALALYTKDDCFTVVLDSEEELESWLNSLLALQQGDEDVANDEPPKPTFEHIWQVNVRNRGLANSKNIVGAHHLCLTSQTLSLVKLNTNSPQIIEFPLMSIRRCGHSYCFFFMELGRSACTGSGELWMQTEDVVIARNMHETILNAMRFTSKEDIGPRQRTRSSSTNESSKPISVHPRRVGTVLPPVGIVATNCLTKRERADSVPTRPRTISDGPLNGTRKSQPWNLENQRPHSMYSHPSSYSPPSESLLPNSPNSIRRDGNGGSCGSIDDHESVQFDVGSFKNWLSSPDNSNMHKSSITEENVNEDYLPMTPSDSNCKPEDKFKSENSSARASLKRLSQSSVSNDTHGISSKASSPSPKIVSDYMDMMPSTANSPSESEGYMAMSPVGSFMPDTPSVKSLTPVKSYASSPIGTQPNIGKTNKKETTNGYVDMAPLGSKSITPDADGYLDMKPTGQENKTGDEAYLNMSPNPKTLTSGTPTEDIRFSEFQLDKVRSYFTPTEQEDEKLVRAYSVGSKPQMCRLAAALDDSASRVRAFSVGSKVGMQFRKTENATPVTLDVSHDANSKKSYSAPLLSNSTSSGSLKMQNENLMELDFAKTGSKSTAPVKGNTEPHSKGTFRSRNSLRLSTGRAGKSDLLQVIGEISNLALETGSTKPAVGNDYAEMNAGKGDSKTEHVSGEYVNIDLDKVRSTSRTERRRSNSSSETHEYANLQAGRLIQPEVPGRRVSPAKDIWFPPTPPECTSKPVLGTSSESPYENVSYGSSTSRPASVSSDKELNYASLDLGSSNATISKDVDDDKPTPPHSPLSSKTSLEEENERLSYARIDFTKSEGLRNTSHTVRKIRQKTT